MRKNLKKIGRRFKNVRLSLKITQAELANMVGQTGSFVSQIETGKKKPSVELLYVLSKMGINVNYILHGKGAVNCTPIDLSGKYWHLIHEKDKKLIEELILYIIFFDKARIIMLSEFCKFKDNNKDLKEEFTNLFDV